MNELSHPDLNDDWITQSCGIVSMSGCAIAAASDIIGAQLSDEISFVSDTISDLAAGGRFDWLADLGLYAFVAAVLAAAIGLSRWRVAGWEWKIGKLLLALMAILVTIVGAYEAYSGQGSKPEVHIYLVYVLGISFPLVVWLKSEGIGKAHGGLKTKLRVFAVLWFLAGPLLFIVPTQYDGLYERFLAFTMMAWFALIGWLLWSETEKTA